MKIVLGSKSPRRKEILSLMGYDYEVRISEAEEIIDETNPLDVVASIARQKANNIPIKDDELDLNQLKDFGFSDSEIELYFEEKSFTIQKTETDSLGVFKILKHYFIKEF